MRFEPPFALLAADPPFLSLSFVRTAHFVYLPLQPQETTPPAGNPKTNSGSPKTSFFLVKTEPFRIQLFLLFASSDFSPMKAY